jgi:catechol 2,3-dioxygenase-like lactoylglutathione lyase family enzyme
MSSIPVPGEQTHVRRFDHVGITVADLDAVTAFFAGLGLEVEGKMFVEGEFLVTVIGIPGSRTEIVMLRPGLSHAGGCVAGDPCHRAQVMAQGQQELVLRRSRDILGEEGA